MALPRVSVVVPTVNRPVALRECLLALARQTWPDFEVIVVCDGGPPVAQVVEEVQAAHPGLALTAIQLPQNCGQVQARNQGITLARGTYLALCDDDDLYLPAHLADLVQALDAGADLAYSDVQLVTMATTPAGRQHLSAHTFAFAYDAALLRRWNFIPTASAAYRRNLHQRLGDLDPATGDYWDWDWWLRIATAGCQITRVPTIGALIAVDAAGDNLSAIPARMRPNLDRLAAKHGLGALPTSNFLQMLSEPELQGHRATTRLNATRPDAARPRAARPPD